MLRFLGCFLFSKAMMKILKEPLLHFLLIGGGLFLLYGMMNDTSAEKPNRVVVTPEQVELLTANFSRTWMRPPTPEEQAHLVREHVRDEVYYREAIALGLDKDDSLIRRRLRQKLEFILDDVAAQLDPSEEMLADFMLDDADRFRAPPHVSFRHVYLSFDKRQDIDADARDLLARLNAGEDPDQFGDPIMLESAFESTSEDDMARQFGDEFARQVVGLPIGVWSGPLASGFGGHLVLVSARVEGRMPELEEVREEVIREWRFEKRKALQEETYRELQKSYDVVIEEPDASAAGSGDETVTADFAGGDA